jgi:hypothetical protein
LSRKPISARFERAPFLLLALKQVSVLETVGWFHWVG